MQTGCRRYDALGGDVAGGSLGQLAEDCLELDTVDLAGAVKVEHVESLLQLLLREHVGLVDGTHCPLGVVNGPAPVHVNLIPDVFHFKFDVGLVSIKLSIAIE